MTGQVGGHGWPGRGERGALLARMAGRVGGASLAELDGFAGLVGWHGLQRRAGMAGISWLGGATVPGLVGQDWAGPGRSSCERTHQWFLEMSQGLQSWPSELASRIKLATKLDT